ncbi:MAG: hypothetical protein K8T10_12805 [Candidatus Eremiobacteraeota bacterium]|nr:hypothetical protein [Candidatus Eremiobacteraeota bacterium]
MDSIFKGDNGDDDKPKQKELESSEEEKEEDVVFYREGVAFEKERKKEVKERIASMVPDEYFEKLKCKSSGKKPACFNCVIIFFVGFVVVLLLLLIWGRKVLENDILSKTPFSFESVELNDEEKESLEIQLSKYENALKKSEESAEEQKVDLVFTQNQINYIFQEYEKSNRPGKKLFMRIYTDGSQATLKISSIYSKKNYINIQLIGIPQIEHYHFKMDVVNIRFGKLKNTTSFKEKILTRINRELDQYPQEANLPFRINTMKIESSKIKVTLAIRRKAEVGSQKTEGGGQRSDDGGQTIEEI